MTQFIWFRPFKAAFLQSAVIKPEAIGIPKENFDFISSTVAEDKPGFTEVSAP
ncbi:hypothetical protein N5E84_14180 [Vibrio sp. J502]|nr:MULTISPECIES: hypothetical protein [Vibrio]UXH27770.1 hypothetical protein N5E84_12240 [Vibrio sp. J502]UXH28102.1 hypothetical protein N5E84_14180 [Vibrio sp. J502]